jgi:hypothetical protein
MKVLGVVQFHQKTFKTNSLKHTKFKDILAEIPRGFVGAFYGYSGNGKTETCIQFAKVLTEFGKVAWLSYEQGHSKSLQRATTRNRMDEVSGKFLIIDPTKNRKEGVSFLEDLDAFLSKRNSPDYVFIDSFDYTRFSWLDYVFLKEKYGEKKGIVFIMHSTKTGKLKKNVAEEIVFDGEFGFFVKDYICYPDKNRLEGVAPYVVWEEEARKRNPAFFAKRVQDSSVPKSKGKSAKKSIKNKGVTEK